MSTDAGKPIGEWKDGRYVIPVSLDAKAVWIGHGLPRTLETPGRIHFDWTDPDTKEQHRKSGTILGFSDKDEAITVWDDDLA